MASGDRAAPGISKALVFNITEIQIHAVSEECNKDVTNNINPRYYLDNLDNVVRYSKG